MNPFYLRDRIQECIDDNSGGVKFVYLITYLTAKIYEDDRADKLPKDLDDFPEMVEKVITERMPSVGILEYTMGPGGLNRTKMFVYNRGE